MPAPLVIRVHVDVAGDLARDVGPLTLAVYRVRDELAVLLGDEHVREADVLAQAQAARHLARRGDTDRLAVALLEGPPARARAAHLPDQIRAVRTGRSAVGDGESDLLGVGDVLGGGGAWGSVVPGARRRTRGRDGWSPASPAAVSLRC